jgi:peptide chain release factor 1
LNFKSEILLSREGHVIAKIMGIDVWKAFAHETGKHIVQRVPPTESKGRRQTSVISVGVLPVREIDTLSKIPDNELEITAERGTGAGGQHRNVTSSCVRIVHKPTKISVVIDGRDQHSNKREALSIITQRVNDYYLKKKNESYNSHKKEVLGDGSRGDKVRTYNFIRCDVTDHRTNKTVSTKDVMKGKFQCFYKN